MTATITTAALALELDTDPRTLRRFLRANEKGVGKGARYALPADKRSIAAMKKKFTKWAEADIADKAAKKGVSLEKVITPDAD